MPVMCYDVNLMRSECGHCRIALIDRQEDPFTPACSRWCQAGYRQALVGAGLQLYPAYEMVADFSPEAGLEALHTLRTLPQPPTAIFVGSDAQAAGVLQGARQLGCRVSEDLSIVGYNDIELGPVPGSDDGAGADGRDGAERRRVAADPAGRTTASPGPGTPARRTGAVDYDGTARRSGIARQA